MHKSCKFFNIHWIEIILSSNFSKKYGRTFSSPPLCTWWNCITINGTTDQKLIDVSSSDFIKRKQTFC